MSDCISRQAVDTLVDELARAISDERCCMSRGRSTATIMQDILDLPSVTQEPKTGHWIYIDEKKAKCSECGYIQITGGKDKTGHCNIHYAIYKYCTNCGCRMVEPQEIGHKCHTCKHYASGEHDGSCGSYFICKEYSNWESEIEE